MKKIFNLSLFLSMFLCIQNVCAQQTFHVSIQIPESWNKQKFSCYYNDGKENIQIEDSIIHNILNVSGKFYSKYAALSIYYNPNDTASFGDTYFIDTSRATIIFHADKNATGIDPFTNYRLINTASINHSEIKMKLDSFDKAEGTAMNDFWVKNGLIYNRVDSLKQIFKKLMRGLNNRNIEFIKQNGNDCFSFWYFRTQILLVTYLYSDSSVSEFENLLNIFKTVFPPAYQSSFEGKEIEEELTGKISTRVNATALDFTTKDIYNNPIQLSNLKGKYVLLDFWATWCPPCMAAIPFIKQIRKTYSTDKLEIISISQDKETDKAKVLRTIKDNKMNWKHIFRNLALTKIFAVTAFPTIIIINKEGKIIFIGLPSDNDKLLALLKENISEQTHNN